MVSVSPYALIIKKSNELRNSLVVGLRGAAPKPKIYTFSRPIAALIFENINLLANQDPKGALCPLVIF